MAMQEQVTPLISQWHAPQRIYIVGGPGAGKSTLARRLQQQLGLPMYGLDQIALEDGGRLRRPVSDRLSRVQAIAAEPTWIAEGIFLYWVDDLLQAADAIIWLDHVHWRTAAWRITLRFLCNAIPGLPQEAITMPEQEPPGKKRTWRTRWWELGRLLTYIRWARSYYHDNTLYLNGLLNGDQAVNRTTTERYLEPHSAKVIHCRTDRDLEALLATVDVTGQLAALG